MSEERIDYERLAKDNDCAMRDDPIDSALRRLGTAGKPAGAHIILGADVDLPGSVTLTVGLIEYCFLGGFEFRRFKNNAGREMVEYVFPYDGWEVDVSIKEAH